MANLVAQQGKYATDDYRDIKALGIGGSASDLALATAQHILDSDTGLWVPIETDHLAGSSTPSGVAASGAGTQTGTGSGVALPSVACKVVLLQNDPDSTTDLLIGGASAQVIQLVPGQTLSAEVSNLNALYIKAVSGSPVCNYLAMT